MKLNIYAVLIAVLAIAPARLSAKDAPGLRTVRSFEPVAEFSITNANVIEVDPALFRLTVISARRAAARSKIALPALRRLLPGPAVIMNAGFFNPADGALIGEFVEDGKRPGGIIYAGAENIDRVFVAGKDATVDVLDGVEKLTDAELARTDFAVAGKSAWPGHSEATNRTAICITVSGKVLLAAVYPVRTIEKLFSYMKSEGCVPEKTINLDGGGSTQMSYKYGGKSWSLGWERKGNSVPECHLAQDNADQRCYRPVATFVAVEPI
jgi:hypothetical protein